jgi:hypothetical protein
MKVDRTEEEWAQLEYEFVNQVGRFAPKPKPKPKVEAEVLPWPKDWRQKERRKLFDQAVRQNTVDQWWQKHLDEVAERNAEPDPGERISREIWGRNRD